MSGEGNPANIPTIPEDNVDGRWLSTHRRFVIDAQEKEPDVVFIGDSIISHLGYTEMWDTHFEPMHALNFGFGGDRVEHVLWRVLNGEMEQMSPKAVVLLVGTNNHGCTADQVAEGIQSIVTAIKDRQPEAYIIVPTLLPRGEKPNPLRERNAAVNDILKELLSSEMKVQLVNIDPGFVQPDGTLTHHDFWDYLHLTKSGYYKAFEPVYDLLLQLLNESDKVSIASGGQEI